MIDFYRIPACAFCDRVEAKLRELVVAHEIHVLSFSDVEPYLLEGKRIYKSRDAIEDLLRQIGREMAISRAAQSDACMIDPDGNGECL